MKLLKRDSYTNMSSRMFFTLVGDNKPTGLYYIIFDKDNPVISEVDSLNSEILINYFIEAMLREYSPKNSSIIKDLFLSQITKEVCTNTPYFVFFVNEKGLETTSFFFTAEADDHLRFAKDWREYLSK